MKNKIDLNKIKNASRQLSQKTEKEKNLFLQNLSDILIHNKTVILKANERDIFNAKKNKLPAAFIQRLTVDWKGIEILQTKLINLQKLKSGVNSVLEEKLLKNGINLKKVCVPIGVILIIYESRPEVTIDVAALCIKSGNAAILKGGSEASYTNEVLYTCILEAMNKSQIAKETITLTRDRNTVINLLKQNQDIDLVIARGGCEMVEKVRSQSKIPLLAHSAGGARIYVDKSANLSQAIDILINAKISKPAACNSLDTILIHKDISDSFIVKLLKRLDESGVTVLYKTTDWDTEFLDLTVSVKIVDNADEAIGFINKHTKKHSEGIIAEDQGIIDKFTESIDVAAIFVNCSTRFHDGSEFGFGSEIGIATGKLHARGPVGLQELTTYKWEAYGNGQIRK
ncbi:glutamate-5-semialdehyde dehydrogenase [Patescibacteria group bacterium]|nr:glutamate-5-semialdehyde dehydrogenase [Patescibacteria group bacterium]MBU4016244.1 glutamate-5-semialdehyde dehydrogenase [Patescibacteria group bacterium]MBU4098427.1 glutamate-5-semialdehyde dehydrogenase [Patescibacteria group bacterium]